MEKIANTNELVAELQQVIAYAKTANPSREKLANALESIAFRPAMEFPTEEAYKAYMKEHPDADPHNHSVAKHTDKSEKSYTGGGMVPVYLEKLKGNKQVLRQKSLKNMDFRDADLSGAHLQNTNFEGADLRGVDFKNAILEHTNFEGADLRGCKNLSDTASFRDLRINEDTKADPNVMKMLQRAKHKTMEEKRVEQNKWRHEQKKYPYGP